MTPVRRQLPDPSVHNDSGGPTVTNARLSEQHTCTNTASSCMQLLPRVHDCLSEKVEDTLPGATTFSTDTQANTNTVHGGSGGGAPSSSTRREREREKKKHRDFVELNRWMTWMALGLFRCLRSIQNVQCFGFRCSGTRPSKPTPAENRSTN